MHFRYTNPYSHYYCLTMQVCPPASSLTVSSCAGYDIITNATITAMPTSTNAARVPITDPATVPPSTPLQGRTSEENVHAVMCVRLRHGIYILPITGVGVAGTTMRVGVGMALLLASSPVASGYQLQCNSLVVSGKSNLEVSSQLIL